MRLSLVWRLTALVALVCYALFVLSVLGLLLRNLGVALALLLGTMLLVYAGWLFFTGNRTRVRLGYVLAFIGAVLFGVSILLLPGDGSTLRAFLLVLATAAAYLALVHMLRKKYWHEARHKGKLQHGTAQFKKPYLIINPKSGDGRAVKAHIKELAQKQGIHVLMLKKGDDVEAVAHRAASAGADVLGISGGDGSIGAVAKVALEKDLPIVVLPGGTRCHFARDLGLNPRQIGDTLAGFHGVLRSIDVADINGRIFLNNVSFGLYADIVDNPDYREHKVAVARGVLRDLVTENKKPYDLRFRHGALQFSSAVQVLVGVNQYKTLDITELGHRERLDEGVLQITAITKLNDVMMAELLKAMSIDKIRSTNGMTDFYQWTAKAFDISTGKRTMVVGVDGERETYKTPVKVTVHPNALRVYVPSEGIRSRPKNPFGVYIVGRLWQAAAHGDVK